ncbi:hypothetical protein [Dictyobacter aurantiacus]|uniref:Haloacid dehalogenase n=1 Tax=Dictyobacter aurantiacus TaxID=1936993 RepID=A0A401ZJW3_9CHLR|nr:hypothetical protein [Dictyobacter aurantiacus]GCE07143.1 hypothetical protein KDAU_44720 [Dictyobacter aurantiacus]
MTKFYCDIDYTLCGQNYAVFHEVCVRLLGIEMAVDTARSLSSDDFLAHPAVVKIREKMGDDEFWWKYEALDFHPHVLRNCLNFKGATQTLTRLAHQYGGMHYATARYFSNPEKQARVAELTTYWLAKYRYPNPDQVAYCDGGQGKLTHLLQRARGTGEQIVLIDDSAARLVPLVDLLPAADQALFRQHIILIGIHCPWYTGLSIASWQDSEQLFTLLEGARDEQEQAHKKVS